MEGTRESFCDDKGSLNGPVGEILFPSAVRAGAAAADEVRSGEVALPKVQFDAVAAGFGRRARHCAALAPGRTTADRRAHPTFVRVALAGTWRRALRAAKRVGFSWGSATRLDSSQRSFAELFSPHTYDSSQWFDGVSTSVSSRSAVTLAHSSCVSRCSSARCCACCGVCCGVPLGCGEETLCAVCLGHARGERENQGMITAITFRGNTGLKFPDERRRWTRVRGPWLGVPW